MSQAAAANWPMAPMVGHPLIAFQKRHSTASPHNWLRLCRNSPSIPSVRAGSGLTWVDRTPAVQLGKEPPASSGSPRTLRKTKPASFLETAKQSPGDLARLDYRKVSCRLRSLSAGGWRDRKV